MPRNSKEWVFLNPDTEDLDYSIEAIVRMAYNKIIDELEAAGYDPAYFAIKLTGEVKTVASPTYSFCATQPGMDASGDIFTT